MSNVKANLDLVERWMDYYNDDVGRMVRECYAADCKVYPMGLGVVEGHAGLHKVEDAVLAKAPHRHLGIERTHASGDVVCVECVLSDPDRGDDWALPFVAILTIRDGRIAIDRTYADWSRWPGV